MGTRRMLAFAMVAGLALAQPALADEEVGLTEVVELLHEEGVIDEEQYAAIHAKAEQKEAQRSWTDRISMWGDFRARIENFWRWSDAAGGGTDDRMRGRYRLRLNTRAEVNEYANVVVQLVSGEGDSRSTNRSFGEGPDFDPDEIAIRLALLELNPLPEGRLLGEEVDVRFEIGKTDVPYVWKTGRDVMLWDHDLSLEGVSWRNTWHVAEEGQIFFNLGYQIIEELSSLNDPALLGLQLGTVWKLGDSFALGARGSYYDFYSLDGDFDTRGEDFGNLPDGLSDGDQIDVLEMGAYLTCSCFEAWPITLYGNWSSNLSAESVPGAGGRQDLAWMIGLEAGDRKEIAALGVGYAYIEADAFPAQFIDSDLLDGFTNRRGFVFYGAREILPSMELNLALFWSRAIENDAVYDVSVEDSNRVRLQADLVVKF